MYLELFYLLIQAGLTVDGCSPSPSQGKTEKYKPCMNTLMPKDNSDLPWKNPYMHRKSMQTPCMKAPGSDLNPEAFSCRRKQKYISANTKHTEKSTTKVRWRKWLSCTVCIKLMHKKVSDWRITYIRVGVSNYRPWKLVENQIMREKCI